MNNKIENMLQNLMPMKLRLLMTEQSINVDILLSYILKDNYEILSKISSKDYKTICNKIISKNEKIREDITLSFRFYSNLLVLYLPLFMVIWLFIWLFIWCLV